MKIWDCSEISITCWPKFTYLQWNIFACLSCRRKMLYLKHIRAFCSRPYFPGHFVHRHFCVHLSFLLEKWFCSWSGPACGPGDRILRPRRCRARGRGSCPPPPAGWSGRRPALPIPRSPGLYLLDIYGYLLYNILWL